MYASIRRFIRAMRYTLFSYDRIFSFSSRPHLSFMIAAFVGTYLHDSNHPPHRNNQQQVGDGEGDENDNNDEKDNNDNNATATFFTNTHSHDNGDGNDTTSSTVPVALPTSRQVAVLYSVVGTWEGHKKKVDVITRLKLEEKHDEESDKSILTIDRATDYLTVNNLVCETIPLFKAIKPRDYESIIFRCKCMVMCMCICTCTCMSAYLCLCLCKSKDMCLCLCLC